MKKALIFGITGQDGAYLAQLLLDKGYQVFGARRPSSLDNTHRLSLLDVLDHITLVTNDLGDPLDVYDIVSKNKFDEIYNLAAQSSVGASWKIPIKTANISAMGPLYILDAIHKTSPGTKFFQASSSEMYGQNHHDRQSEKTPLSPRSPYGVAKQFAHAMTASYRDGLGIHASSGILFNHESPLRDLDFVTRKITNQLARVSLGKQKSLLIGNIDVQRDWGYARDYVWGMWLMLQQDTPDDYVLATGQKFSVRHFIETAALHLGIDLAWEGQGVTEVGIDQKNGQVVVKVSAEFYRPNEIKAIVGDPTKAKEKLGWEANCSITELIALMTEYDFNIEKQSKH